MEKSKESILSTVNLVVRVLCLIAVVYFVARCIDAGSEDDVAIEDTPVVIESIKPIGQLYAYTAITEDYAIDNVEKVGWFSRSNYKAVQTLRMQVSYVMDLDSVEYEVKQKSDTVVVRLPQLRYIQSAQGGNLLCEVEVPATQFDAARAIHVVEEKIRSKYDTQANRDKAMQHAREVLTTFIAQCGLTPKFEDK